MAKSRKRSEPDTTAQSSTRTAEADRPERFEPGRRDEETGSESEGRSEADGRRHEYDRERVAQRAYELYLSRGGGHGSDWEDWLAAERELVGNRGNEDDSSNGSGQGE